MSIATLEQFKAFLRELSDNLDSPLQLAIDSATAECNAFVGFDVEEEFASNGSPSDLVMACMLLAQAHADAGSPNDNDYRRAAAQSLMRPYRTDVGIAA